MGDGPTNPAEQFFRRGLWGWASTTWERLYSLSNLLGVALHGYDGSAWRKLSLLWGYTGVVAEVVSDLDADAGDNTLTIVTVPAGYVYVINAIMTQNQTNAVAHRHMLATGGTQYAIKEFLAHAAGTWAINDNISYVLAAGDKAQVQFIACTADDNLLARLWGYKMAVT